jgi:probable phosphoglycerate mutase
VSAGGEAAHEVVLVRHGRTEWARTGRHTGRADVGLDEHGRVQARALAPRLGGRSFAAVLTSPSSRARDTCALAGLGDAAVVDVDLAEWDYGADEGRTTAEIRVERPGWTVWGAGPEGGETVAEVAERADRVVATIERSLDAGDVAVFGHGHALRVLCARWLGLDGGAGRLFTLEPASVSALRYEREQRVIGTWNVT